MNSSQPRTSLRKQLHCIHSQHTHTPCTATCTTHPAIPSQLPSTTLLCTQLTNTKHSWQNGTRCRDGVNVLWCRSHLVWLVFEGSIPTYTCFHSENFFQNHTGARYQISHCALWSGFTAQCEGLVHVVCNSSHNLHTRNLLHINFSSPTCTLLGDLLR